MNDVLIALILGILGIFLGSFVGATVWRIRVRQLKEDEDSGEKVPARSKKEVARIKRSSVLTDRSVCLHCGHQLKWFDLIPLFSWVQLRGKCRYCGRKIGLMEPMVELGVGAYFAVSYLFWPEPLILPLEITQFTLWLLSGVGLAILFVYDMKWFLLPNRIVFPLIYLGLLNGLIVLYDNNFALTKVVDIMYSCLILSGLYYFIYVLSRHQWVGFGDVKLALALALMLADWRLAILALFLANVIGTLIVLPLLVGRKIQRQAHVPFGPMLIGGWFLSGLFGTHILNWYITLSLG